MVQASCSPPAAHPLPSSVSQATHTPASAPLLPTPSATSRPSLKAAAYPGLPGKSPCADHSLT